MTCGPGEVCITCSDAADAMVVRAVDATGLATCTDAVGAETEVDVSLVDAAPGDRVLVHAGVAIGMAA